MLIKQLLNSDFVEEEKKRGRGGGGEGGVCKSLNLLR